MAETGREEEAAAEEEEGELVPGLEVVGRGLVPRSAPARDAPWLGVPAEQLELIDQLLEVESTPSPPPSPPPPPPPPPPQAQGQDQSQQPKQQRQRQRQQRQQRRPYRLREDVRPSVSIEGASAAQPPREPGAGPVGAALRLLKLRREQQEQCEEEMKEPQQREEEKGHEDHELLEARAAATRRVVVSARVRPLLPGEQACHSNLRKALCAEPSQRSVTAWPPAAGRLPTTPSKRKVFAFDHVFDETSSQAQVFHTVAVPLVEAVLRGINGCLIAYGQTGAGKTFTMFGPAQAKEASTAALGLIPRLVHALFDALEAKVQASRDERRRQRRQRDLHGEGVGGAFSFALYVTYYQIYLDSHIQDLLAPGERPLQLRMRDKQASGVHEVQGLKRCRVTSVSEVLELLQHGDQNKVVSQTAMNALSSRSHSIFTLELVQQHTSCAEPGVGPTQGGPAAFTTSGKLTCVDLAGSERASRTQPEGLQLEEAKAINRSLSALGNVVAALSSGKDLVAQSEGAGPPPPPQQQQQQQQQTGFVPWRDSKLTKVLQGSLSGRAQVSLVINVGPDAANVKESINSLLFGRRSMQVSLAPEPNVGVDYPALVHQLRTALERASDTYQARLAQLEDKLLGKSRELEDLKLAVGSGASRGPSGAILLLESRLQQTDRAREAAERALSEERQAHGKLRETHDLLEEALLEQLEANAGLEQTVRELASAAQVKKEEEEEEEEEADAGRPAKEEEEEEKERELRSAREKAYRLEAALGGEQLRADELAIGLEERTAELEAARAELRRRVEIYERQLMGADERLASEVARARAQSAQVSQLRAELAAAEDTAREGAKSPTEAAAQPQSSTSASTKARAKLKACRKQLEAVSQERAVLESRVTALEEQLAAARAEVEQASSARDALSEQLTETAAAEARAREQVRALQERLGREAVEAMARLTEAKREAEGLRSVGARDSRELEAARDAAATSQREAEARGLALEEARGKLADAETRLAEEADRNAGVLRRLEAAETKLQSITQLQEEERHLYEALIAAYVEAQEVDEPARRPAPSPRASSPRASPGRSPAPLGLELATDLGWGEEPLDSPKLKIALTRSKMALARAMEAINEV